LYTHLVYANISDFKNIGSVKNRINNTTLLKPKNYLLEIEDFILKCIYLSLFYKYKYVCQMTVSHYLNLSVILNQNVLVFKLHNNIDE